MSGWGRRIRGAVGMGLCWAAGWPIGGVLIGVTSNLLPGLPWDAFFEVFDAPLPALAIPGFFGGALFSIVLGIAGRRRRFSEMSVAGSLKPVIEPFLLKYTKVVARIPFE